MSRILQNQIAHVQHISPITIHDLPLYHKFFTQDAHIACYGNSWAYITQACRGFGLGLKYYDRDILLSIGLHRGHCVVVRPLGIIDQRFIKILDTLRKLTHKPVFIKKLFPPQVALLHQLGNFNETAIYAETERQAYAGEYPWDRPAFADDDTYPELIFDLDTALLYHLKPRKWLKEFAQVRVTPLDQQGFRHFKRGYETWRRHINQFQKQKIRCYLAEYRINKAEEVRQFLTSYFGEAHIQNLAAYENMLTMPQVPDYNGRYFRWIGYTEEGKTPVGFFFLERLDDKSAGSYAGITSRQHRGLPEYLEMRIMRRLQAIGIKFLNTGGSESRSLYIFKRKPGPIEERHMKMLVYGLS